MLRAYYVKKGTVINSATTFSKPVIAPITEQGLAGLRDRLKRMPPKKSEGSKTVEERVAVDLTTGQQVRRSTEKSEGKKEVEEGGGLTTEPVRRSTRKVHAPVLYAPVDPVDDVDQSSTSGSSSSSRSGSDTVKNEKYCLVASVPTAGAGV